MYESLNFEVMFFYLVTIKKTKKTKDIRNFKNERNQKIKERKKERKTDRQKERKKAEMCEREKERVKHVPIVILINFLTNIPEPRGQFHQRSTGSLYSCRSQKRIKAA